MPKIDLPGRLGDAPAQVRAQEGARRALIEPMYARLERKEVRLRADQLADLTALVRAVMRARRVKDERITENTLIRVAVDLLLTRREHLRGATEQQLLASVTTAPRRSRTAEPATPATPALPESRGRGLR